MRPVVQHSTPVLEQACCSIMRRPNKETCCLALGTLSFGEHAMYVSTARYEHTIRPIRAGSPVLAGEQLVRQAPRSHLSSRTALFRASRFARRGLELSKAVQSTKGAPPSTNACRVLSQRFGGINVTRTIGPAREGIVSVLTMLPIASRIPPQSMVC